MPYANDTAHKPFQECSNFGYCDRITGTCVCRAGYTGHACERMSCPSGGPRGSSCSGHGHCLNLKEAGETEMYLGNRADAFDGTVNSSWLKQLGYCTHILDLHSYKYYRSKLLNLVELPPPTTLA
jgi:hypothetical protein